VSGWAARVAVWFPELTDARARSATWTVPLRPSTFAGFLRSITATRFSTASPPMVLSADLCRFALGQPRFTFDQSRVVQGLARLVVAGDQPGRLACGQRNAVYGGGRCEIGVPGVAL
jgi:hypothetical protein